MWPFTRKAPAIVTKSLADPTDSLFELFHAVPSAAGIAVTPITAMRCSAVRCAIQTISEAVGQLPFGVFDRETREKDDIHPVAQLLNVAANDWTSAADFQEQMTRDAHLYGDGLAHIVRANGVPKEMIRIIPGTVSITPDEYGGPVYTQDATVLNREDVFHIKAPGVLGWRGNAPIELAREAIGLALILEQFTARLFANGATPGSVVTFQKDLGDSAVSKFLAAWKASHQGADNAGKPMLLFDGATFQQVGFDPVSAQLLELRKFSVTEIARAFRVQPVLLMDFERGTWSNSEQMAQFFLTYSLTPWLNRWEGEVLLKLFTPEERATRVAEYDVDGILRADFAARMSGYSSAIASRIINPNEARRAENLPDYDGGDVFANPNTTPGAAPKPANDNTPTTPNSRQTANG